MNFLHYLIGKLWRDHTASQERVLNIVLLIAGLAFLAWMLCTAVIGIINA